MDEYFTTRQGAIQRLLAIRCDIAASAYSPITVVGHRKDGLEVSGIERVLLNARAGRLSRFVCTGAAEDQLRFYQLGASVRRARRRRVWTAPARWRSCAALISAIAKPAADTDKS